MTPNKLMYLGYGIGSQTFLYNVTLHKYCIQTKLQSGIHTELLPYVFASYNVIDINQYKPYTFIFRDSTFRFLSFCTSIEINNFDKTIFAVIFQVYNEKATRQLSYPYLFRFAYLLKLNNSIITPCYELLR